MTRGVPTRVIASSLGLSAFAVAIIAGLRADNAADDILARALASMFVCHVLGWVIGLVGERAAAEVVLAHRAGVAGVGGAVAEAPASKESVDDVLVV